MNGKQLKNSILQWAIQGKLVPQDPYDEPASVLLDKIRQEKERLIKEKKIKRDKNASIIYRGEDNSYYEKLLATGEVKCIDEEVPFEIPTSWSWARLMDVSIYIQRGKSPKYSHIKKYPVVAQKCNQWAGFSIDKAQFIEPDSLSKYAVERILQDEDLMWNSTGLGTLGRMAVYYARLNPYELAVADSHVTVIRLFKPFMSPLFFYFYFASPTVQSVIEDKSDGSTKQKELSTTTVCNYLVPIPPRSEQTRIISKVTSLLPIIERYGIQQEKLDNLNKTIKELIKKSVLQEAIQGKLVPQIAKEGTAAELLEHIKVEKQKLVKEGKLKKSALNDSVIFRGADNKYYEQIGKKCLDITEQIPFEIPSNWEWCRVRNVSNSYIGLTYKPTDIDEKGTIVLRSCNIRNGKLALDDIVRVSSSISEKLLIEENDIIICARNGSKRLVGKSALIRNLSEPMTFGAFMAICKTPIYEYMFAYLQSDLFFGQLRDVSNTTTINQLTQNKFNDFLIPIPPIREQERIAFKISQLFQKLR